MYEVNSYLTLSTCNRIPDGVHPQKAIDTYFSINGFNNNWEEDTPEGTLDTYGWVYGEELESSEEDSKPTVTILGLTLEDFDVKKIMSEYSILLHTGFSGSIYLTDTESGTSFHLYSSYVSDDRDIVICKVMDRIHVIKKVYIETAMFDDKGVLTTIERNTGLGKRYTHNREGTLLP
jgi:hypothetical protein